MKRNILSIVLTALLMLVGQSVSAYDFVVNGIYYKYLSTTDKTVAVTFKGDKYDSYSDEYAGTEVIPASVTYGGATYSVTSIDSYAFCECTYLKSINIPNSVTSIGSYAFHGCTGLTSIKIPNSVTSIGSSAFYGCAGMTNIEIPNSVTSIGSSAFSGCSGLTSSEIPSSVKNIGSSAFYGCSGKLLIHCNIGNAVSSRDGWFYGSKFNEVVIGEEVTCIGNYAFSGCTGLTCIEIPSSVTSIGSGAFSGCSSLESITLPFVGDKPHTPSDTYQYPFGYIFGTSSYTGCTSTHQSYYGSSTSSTTSSTFYIPSSLKSVTITSSSYIPYGAFSNYSGLTSIEIPNCVTSIGSAAFSGCTGLTSIEIPNCVTSIGSAAFSGCSSLETITLPFVGDKPHTPSETYQYTFGYIFGTNSYTGGSRTVQYNSNTTYSTYYIPSSLKSVKITGSTHIPYGAFENCKGLTSIEIPNCVTSIGGTAFYNCTGLTSIEIPNCVANIGSGAFAGCTGLTSIIVASGNNVYDSRNNCNAIIKTSSNTLVTGCKNTIVPNGVTSLGNYAFYNCTGLTSIEIPNSVTSIGKQVFQNCSGLTSIVIPNSVTSIGSSAFNGCSSLETITLPFVGDKPHAPSDTYQYPFGYIFGTDSFTDGTSTEQSYYGSSTSNTTSNTYYIPASLKSVTITGSKHIPYGAFYNCTGLITIDIPNSVTSIGNEAFYCCTSLNKAEFASIESLCGISFASNPANPLYYAKHLYLNGEEIKDLVIPSSVTSIGNYTFINCADLTSIEIPNSVTSIGSYAFEGCTGLTSIEIPNSVTSIGDCAFRDCTGLKKTEFASIESLCGISFASNPANPLYYAKHLYLNGEEIKDLVIPSSVTSIGNYTFINCADLTSIEIPNSVTSIGNSAFRDCSGLTSVNIPNSVTSIGSSAFSGCI